MHLECESQTLTDDCPDILLPNSVNSCSTACCQEKDS